MATIEPTDQEKRSREIADKIRTYLSALHTGGIAITFAVAGTLAGQKVPPSWAVWPVSAFTVGLVVLGLSLFLAKHKAKKRDQNPDVNFRPWYWHNFTYDLLSMFVFVIAVGVGLWQLQCIRLP
jgi:hypothetical protein